VKLFDMGAPGRLEGRLAYLRGSEKWRSLRKHEAETARWSMGLNEQESVLGCTMQRDNSRLFQGFRSEGFQGFFGVVFCLIAEVSCKRK
jgi:hypothetical protein